VRNLLAPKTFIVFREEVWGDLSLAAATPRLSARIERLSVQVDFSALSPRRRVARPWEGLNISVTAIGERELDEQDKTVFRNAASRVQCSAPWTKDHKTAALAASIILATGNDLTLMFGEPSRTDIRAS